MKRAYIVSLSIILIVLALALLWIFNTTLLRRITPPPALPANSIIPTDSTKDVVIGSNQSLPQTLLAAEQTLSPASGTVVSVNTDIDSQTFLTDIGPHAPQSLLESLAAPYMVGFYSSSTNAWQPFIIFKITSYSNALAGMRTWEPTMSQDLADITGTASTTTSPQNASFQDAVIENINIRELDTIAGTPALLYAFPDSQTIVITTSETALREIIARLSPQSFPK